MRLKQLDMTTTCQYSVKHGLTERSNPEVQMLKESTAVFGRASYDRQNKDGEWKICDRLVKMMQPSKHHMNNMLVCDTIWTSDKHFMVENRPEDNLYLSEAQGL